MNSTILRQRLLSSGLAVPESMRGCSPNELMQIETVAQRPLPGPYVDFMKHFGKEAGRFMRDIDIFFPKVLNLKAKAVALLEDEEDPELSLPNGAFVFAVRNGEQFVCFSENSDDPPIQFYIAEAPAITTIADSFWEFISSELELCESNYEAVKGTPFDLRPQGNEKRHQ